MNVQEVHYCHKSRRSIPKSGKKIGPCLLFSYLHCRKMLEENHITAQMCSSIPISQEDQKMREKVKQKWTGELLFYYFLCPGWSPSPQFKWLKNVLWKKQNKTRCSHIIKICFLFLLISLCLCGWLQALFLFNGHIHAEGNAGREFKETGHFSQMSLEHFRKGGGVWAV